MNQSKKPIILVADPDPTAIAQTTRILSCEKYNLFSAICPSSAYSAAMSMSIDLLICDTAMGAMGQTAAGEDLIQAIHGLPQCLDVPVIFTSSGQAANVIWRQHDFGGAYHLKKPLDTVVLNQLLEKVLVVPRVTKPAIKQPHFNASAPFPATFSSGPIGGSLVSP